MHPVSKTSLASVAVIDRLELAFRILQLFGMNQSKAPGPIVTVRPRIESALDPFASVARCVTDLMVPSVDTQAKLSPH